MLYHLGFDVSELTLGTITLATAGETDVVVTMENVTGTDQAAASSSLFWMYRHSSGDYKIRGEDPDQTTHLSTWAKEGYVHALEDALRAEATTQSWATPSNIDVTIAAATGLVTIAYSATLTVTWSATAGRDFLGFSANQSGSSSYTGDQTPEYIINPSSSYTSRSTPNYEPQNIATGVVSNSGHGTGTRRKVSPLYRDWFQEFETKAKTLRMAAASAHPCTLQDLFERSRTEFPFIVVDGFGESNDECFRLRMEGSHWDAQSARATPGNDNQFHKQFQTIVEGEVVAA